MTVSIRVVKCKICESEKRPFRHGRCERCSCYFVLHGKERPLDHPGRGQFRKPKLSTCKCCGNTFDAIHDRKKRKAKFCSVNCRDLFRRSTPEKRKENYKRYNRNHLNERSVRGKNYYIKNKHKIKERAAKWRAANKEVLRIKSANYRVKLKENGGTLSKNIAQKLFAIQKGKCSICKKSVKKSGFHLDHIVPLLRGGANTDRNIQLTCPTCNMKKSWKDPIKFMQEMGYLL